MSLIFMTNLSSESYTTASIDRHKAAISRNDLSKPVRLAVEAGLLGSDTNFLDYGCGQGGDVARLSTKGISCQGWDPFYRPHAPRHPSDVVNLGYIINVIESQTERRDTLTTAWNLTGRVLIVAAQVLVIQGNDQIAYGDGIVTRRNTFQKYYEQEELKAYIDQVLGVDAIPVALGIYFIFRDEAQAEIFRASRFRSRTTTPRIRHTNKRFEDYQQLLSPLMAFFTERGRLPIKDELASEIAINSEFGSLRRAFQVIVQATDTEEWGAITHTRQQDLMVYLALTKFGHRPRIGQLAIEVQNDIKILFGSYRQACEQADEMLFGLGDLSCIASCCRKSKIGKILPDSLYVHVSALEEIDPVLRLYEGCASRTIGRMDGATIIKFSTTKPKISYLFYPKFDTDPHPSLHTSMQVDLRDLKVTYRDYDSSDNPPILHRKETFVSQAYPRYEKFSKLTLQEERWGLLDNPKTIGTRKGWLDRLEKCCADLQGHRVVWRKNADPYQVKLTKSIQRQLRSNSAKIDFDET